MSTEQQHLHSAAVSHIHQCFNRINQQVEQAGKEVAAYYFYLVDDFFAAGELYQVAYRSIENLDDDDIYQQKRTEYETALIAALQQCDQEGLFGNRAENGILLFAFYIDDYDENDEQSLLYRSAAQLNQPDTYQKLIG